MYDDDQFAIFEKYIKYPEDDGLIRYYVYYDAKNDYLDTDSGQAYVQRLATEEEKATLFQAIKDNGYKWNDTTKTLEKVIEPKFKVGNRIKHKCENFRGERTITSYDKHGYCTSINDWIDYEDQDNWILIPNKFDPKTLQHFDKVLVSSNDEWFCDFFSHYDNDSIEYNCICTGGCPYECCIPYNDDTKHLVGKSIEEAPEFYRYWEG